MSFDLQERHQIQIYNQGYSLSCSQSHDVVKESPALTDHSMMQTSVRDDIHKKQMEELQENLSKVSVDNLCMIEHNAILLSLIKDKLKNCRCRDNGICPSAPSIDSHD